MLNIYLEIMAYAVIISVFVWVAWNGILDKEDWDD